MDSVEDCTLLTLEILNNPLAYIGSRKNIITTKQRSVEQDCSKPTVNRNTVLLKIVAPLLHVNYCETIFLV